MHLFYAPDIRQTLTLSEEESHHAIKVLRLQAGDSVCVLDGQGGRFEASIAVAHPKHCLLNALCPLPEHKPRPYHLHLAVAPTKNLDRWEWLAEKAVEIGLDELTPLICRYSERRTLNTERTQKILVAALKQSMQPYITRLYEPQAFLSWIHTVQVSQKYIAHCHSSAEKRPLSSVLQKGGEVLILIGPEGDFSAEEVTAAKACGFQEVSLGESRLRVETAALVACHSVCLLNEL